VCAFVSQIVTNKTSEGLTFDEPPASSEKVVKPSPGDVIEYFFFTNNVILNVKKLYSGQI